MSIMSVSEPSVNNSNWYLHKLEDKAALELLPTLVLLGVLAVVGNVGNALALYVYYTRFNPSSTRTYILAMSVFDMLFSSLTLPGEILDLRFSLTYRAAWLCRIHRFLAIFLTLVSGFILVVVALDRQRKICHSFRAQLTSRKVNQTVLGCILLAVVIGVPFGAMNGHHTVVTGVPGVVGSACSVDDQFLNTSFPLVYNIILALVFLACAAAMITSYVLIGRKVVKHKRASFAGNYSRAKGLALALENLESDATNGDSKANGSSPSDKNSQGAEIAQGNFTLNNNLPYDESFKGEGRFQPEAITSEINADEGRGSNRLQSRSVRMKEEEFEVAVRTLVDAISEDKLQFNEPVNQQQARHRFVRNARSQSVGDEPTGFQDRPVTKIVRRKSEQNLNHISNGAASDVFDVHNDIAKIRNTPTKRETVTVNSQAAPSCNSNGIVFTDTLPQRTESFTHQTVGSHGFHSRLHNTLRKVKSLKGNGQESFGRADEMTVSLRRHGRKKIPSRTTWMMFVLTAIFVISYLPYLTITSVRAAYNEVELGLSGWKLNLYTIALKSYFINSIVNPVVYSFCSARFRHQCRHLIGSRKKFSVSS